VTHPRTLRALACCVAVAAVLASCSDNKTKSGGATSSSAAVATDRSRSDGASGLSGSSAASDNSGSSAGVNTSGPYAVGRRSVTFVDKTRITNADPQRNLPERPDRTLPVMLLYPATGPVDPEGAPADDAAPTTGRFPLVVFSHGITASGPVYTIMLQRWARAGYVVAAPTFPLSGPGAKFPGDGVALADYNNQPADVSFVISSVLAANGDSKDPLHGRIDARRIAAGGHSLGAITTLGLVYNSCCIDKRIKAAIEISGIELPFKNGSFDNSPATPLLLVHGAKDNTVPIGGGSDAIFPKAKPPEYYLRYPAGSHISPIFSASLEYTNAAAIAFLDATLKGEPKALQGIPEKVSASGGLATWQPRPT